MTFIFATTVEAQIINNIEISGLQELCKGDSEIYEISQSSGVNYIWEVSNHGNISGNSTGGEIVVNWMGDGIGQVYVTGTNITGDTIEQGMLNIDILKRPFPFVIWDHSIECIKYDRLGQYVSSNIDLAANEMLQYMMVCENAIVEYTVLNPVDGSLNWEVNGAGGNLLGTQNNSAEVKWEETGFGILTVNNAYDSPLEYCDGTTLVLTQVLAKPEADYYILPEEPGGTFDNPLTICEGTELYFIDNSTSTNGFITSWFWDFGYGPTSTEKNPSHVFNEPGDFDVTLTVTTECNCTDTYLRTIKVIEIPNEVSIQCSGVICENMQSVYHLHFENSTVESVIEQCLSTQDAEWSVQGGSILSDPTENFIVVLWDDVPSSGFGYVMLDIELCGLDCTFPLVLKVPVIVNNAEIIDTSQLICSGGNQYHFSLPQWPSTLYHWEVTDIGDNELIFIEQSNQVILNTGEAENIVLTAFYENTLYNCGGMATVEIEVMPPIEITGPQKVCVNSQEAYTLPSPLTGNWSLFGPNNFYDHVYGNSFEPTFTEVGLYLMTVSGDGFCSSNNFVIEVLNYPANPSIINGAEYICPEDPYTYSTGLPANGSVFHWDVIGGQIIGSNSGQFVDIIFSGTEPYKVLLWSQTNNPPHCSSDTIFMDVYLAVPDIEINGVDEVCPNSTETYSIDYLEGEVYEWFVIPNTAGSIESGDGTNQVDVLWHHTLSGLSTQVVVKVRKCTYFYYDTLDVEIIEMPEIEVDGELEVCANTSLSISLSGSIALPGGSNVLWTYPGGQSTGLFPSPSIQKDNVSGSVQSYPLSVELIHPFGCESIVLSLDTFFEIKPKPNIKLDIYGIYGFCPPAQVDLTTTLTYPNGSQDISTLAWYQDEVLDIQCSPGTTCNSYEIDDYGLYYVIATGTNGCTAQSDLLLVEEACPPEVCTLHFNPTVTLDVIDIDCGRATLEYSYDYSPVSTFFSIHTSGLSQVSHIGNEVVVQANEPGEYLVSFSALYENNQSEICTIMQFVNVVLPLIADLDYLVTCNTTNDGYLVTVFDNSQYLNGVKDIEYSFGFNSETPFETANHSYTYGLESGGHAVNLGVDLTFNSNNYYCETQWHIVVLPVLPTAAFNIEDPNPACENFPVQFTNLSTPSTGLSFHLDFGESPASNLVENPINVYGVIGSKIVHLTVTNQYGCYDTISHIVEIIGNEMEGNLMVLPNDIICDDEFAILEYDYEAGEYPSSFVWMKDLEFLIQTDYDPITINQSGAYWAKLYDDYGCVAYTEKTTVVFIKKPEVYISGNPVHCAGSSFSLFSIINGVQNLTYQWYLDGNPINDETHPFLNIEDAASGVYSYQLEVSYMEYGEFCSTLSSVFEVTVVDLPPAPFINLIIDCEGGALYAELSTGQQGGNPSGTYVWNTGQNTTTIYGAHGGFYEVVFTDGNGCKSTQNRLVPYLPETFFWMFPKGCYEFCDNWFPVFLPGPNTYFDEWHYYKDSVQDVSGSDVTDPYFLDDVSATYYYVALSGNCEQSTELMDVEIERECRDCDITLDIQSYQDELNGDCYIFSDFEIYNPFSNTLSVVLKSDMGTFIPSSKELVNGINNFTLIFIPNSTYVSGSVSVELFAYEIDPYSGEVSLCYLKDDFEFPEQCSNEGKPLNSISEILPELNTMIALIPNPADNSLSVMYHYDTNNLVKGQVAIYTIYGRLIKSVNLYQAEGNIEVDVSHYPPGIYIVSLLNETGFVAHSRLLITR